MSRQLHLEIDNKLTNNLIKISVSRKKNLLFFTLELVSTNQSTGRSSIFFSLSLSLFFSLTLSLSFSRLSLGCQKKASNTHTHIYVREQIKCKKWKAN